MIRRADEEQLEFASRDNRVLYSFNVRHFHKIHCDWRNRARPRRHYPRATTALLDGGGQIRRLLRLIASVSAEAMKNREEFLGGW